MAVCPNPSGNNITRHISWTVFVFSFVFFLFWIDAISQKTREVILSFVITCVNNEQWRYQWTDGDILLSACADLLFVFLECSYIDCKITEWQCLCVKCIFKIKFSSSRHWRKPRQTVKGRRFTSLTALLIMCKMSILFLSCRRFLCYTF